MLSRTLQVTSYFPACVYVWVVVIDPNCPVPFSTSCFSPAPKPNSAAVMSLSGSKPAHANVTVRGLGPAPGLTDMPVQRGGLFVGVGVSVGVADGVGVTDGVGVSVGVIVPEGVGVGVVLKSALLRTSYFSEATAQSKIGSPIRRLRIM